MSERPRVSIVVPAFQSEAHIGRTLASLRRQRHTDYEVIVVNDGSTDGTAEVVRRAAQVDPRIRLLEQENGGTAAARNLGIAAARGDVVAFLDDDDLWHPEKLALQLARLDAAPGAAVVSCHSALLDPDGRLLGWRLGGAPEGDVYREMLEWDMVSGGSVALVSRRALEEVGGFDAKLAVRADWDLWIRLARRHRFGCVPRVLVGYTRRPGSVSHAYGRMVEDGRAVLAKARREDAGIGEAEHRAWIARDLFGAACFCLMDERPASAWPYVARSIRRDPRMILAKPRRWGILGMLTLATVLLQGAYRRVLSAMGRLAFGLPAGATFDSLGSAPVRAEGRERPRPGA